MSHFKLTLAYDGTAYHGWQVQSEQRTIQGTIEAAILKLTGQSVRVMASGRTDAGVHALAQVASFTADCRLTAVELGTALNAVLPEDIAILNVSEVPAGFHPIRDAVRKCYRYVIHNGPVRDVFARRFAWHVVQPLDLAAMQRAAAALLGTHDFSSFETAGAPRESSVRTVSRLELFRDAVQPAKITLEIEADGFLYNMVRAIVGTLVEVGRGGEPEDWPARVLAAQDRCAGGPTAPPQGLFLVYVEYQ
jgi:tRNA pseudouridine38-40 synthase